MRVCGFVWSRAAVYSSERDRSVLAHSLGQGGPVWKSVNQMAMGCYDARPMPDMPVVNCPQCGRPMPYIDPALVRPEWKAPTMYYVCMCPIHGMHHLTDTSDLIAGPPTPAC
jgi:hypothetical protein